MSQNIAKDDIAGIRKDMATKDDLSLFATAEDIHEFRKEINARFDTIEKDLKSVVRIYNLDEEMAAVYARLQRLETKVGVQQGM